MSELSREQFIAELVQHVREKFPLVKIGPADKPFSLKVNDQIAGLENIYRVVQLRPQERLHHIDRWIVELLRAAEGTPDRLGSFEELKDRILPMVLPGSAVESFDDVVGSTLVDGLSIAYAVDQDRTISYIPRKRFDSWGMSTDALHELAIQNLVNRSESLAAHAAEDDDGNVNLILFQTMDGYDASRVLLPTLHDRLRAYLGSPFGAAIPNRDILLCFRNDPQTVERLRKQVREDYRQMPHQLTDQLLLITADGIAVRNDD